jgi:hypothetical protein
VLSIINNLYIEGDKRKEETWKSRWIRMYGSWAAGATGAGPGHPNGLIYS